MNRLNKHQPYQPYKNVVDAFFDVRQPTPEDKRVTGLIGAHNSTALALEEFQQRYEQLSVEERRRVNAHLQNVYEILGLGPGEQLEEGQSYYQLFQYLLTNMNDIIVRTGRLEQLVEQILAQVNRSERHAHKTDTPLPLSSLPSQEMVEGEHENRNRNTYAHRNRNRKTVTVTQEMRIIVCANYRKIPNAEIADACGCSLSTIEKAIAQLKQEGQIR